MDIQKALCWQTAQDTVSEKDISMNLYNFIRTVPDTPKPGILFYDISPLLAHGEAFACAVRQMYEAALPLAPTKIVAPDARGFLFAAPLAYLLGIGMVPVRKPGKLPCACHTVAYDLEYGSNSLCIHKDALCPEDRVLVVDDVLATGGTLNAMLQLTALCGASVVGSCFLLELDNLKGRDVLGTIPLSVLLHVQG